MDNGPYTLDVKAWTKVTTATTDCAFLEFVSSESFGLLQKTTRIFDHLL